jgi:hypothetical protein
MSLGVGSVVLGLDASSSLGWFVEGGEIIVEARGTCT